MQTLLVWINEYKIRNPFIQIWLYGFDADKKLFVWILLFRVRLKYSKTNSEWYPAGIRNDGRPIFVYSYISILHLLAVQICYANTTLVGTVSPEKVCPNVDPSIFNLGSKVHKCLWGGVYVRAE